MIQYLARRTLHAIILVAITLTISFAILHLAPGDPLVRFVGAGVDPADIERVRRSLGLDERLPVQYARWVGGVIRGDFGTSLAQNRPVRDMLADAVPRTILLTLLALGVQMSLGIWAGAAAARRRHARADRFLSFLTVALYAIPPFYLAYLLMTWLAIDRHWLPTSGIATPGLDAGGVAMLADRARHLLMPVLVLGVASAAGFARYARGSLIDALGEDFVRTARAKGLPEGTVVWRHAFRSSLGTLITVTGLSAPFLIGGAVIVETVFAWPGMGSLMVASIYARDYPVVLAVNMLGALFVIAGNLLADVGSAWADPRAGHPETGRE
ncbi:MAG TPA: ABC transporter permease [Candidatus Krumholzibacteria bacterium]|nr:ABC transporter permease [Candidatus Krumholzibacteria bacterium]